MASVWRRRHPRPMDRSRSEVGASYAAHLMRTVVKVFVALVGLIALVIAGYSLLLIGLDLFGEQTRDTGMRIATGVVGLFLALVLGLVVAVGLRYLAKTRTHE